MIGIINESRTRDPRGARSLRGAGFPAVARAARKQRRIQKRKRKQGNNLRAYRQNNSSYSRIRIRANQFCSNRQKW
ncbi:hypothetical protein AAHH79_29845 [Burkholderia pseudomallei]